MSRSIRKETSSLAFGIVGRFGGSSAGFVVAALNAASAASREVVVLRVLSAGIYVPALGLHSVKRKLDGPTKACDRRRSQCSIRRRVAAAKGEFAGHVAILRVPREVLRMRPSYMPIVFLCQSISR